MASIKLNYGSTTETCWSDTNKITTPSLILNDGGTIRYTPLFSGSAGGTVVNGNYKYTLGHLVVDGKRVAISRANNTWTNTLTVYFYKYKYTKKVHVASTCTGTTYTTYYYVDYKVKIEQANQNGSGYSVGCDGCTTTTSSSSYVTIRTTENSSGYSEPNPTLYIYPIGSSNKSGSYSVTWDTTVQSKSITFTGTY